MVDEYEDRVIVGEVNLRDTMRIAAYYGAGASSTSRSTSSRSTRAGTSTTGTRSCEP